VSDPDTSFPAPPITRSAPARLAPDPPRHRESPMTVPTPPLPTALTSRRSFVGLTAAAAGSLALAACGGSSDEEVDAGSQNLGAMDSYEAGQQFKATEPITLSILWTDWPEQPVTETWKVFDHIEE